MKSIKDYFEKLGKKVVDLQIDLEINKPCSHCGYGKMLTGSATLVCNSDNESDINSNESESSDKESNNSNEFEKDSENVNFIFKTGCLTYDAELIFE